MVGDWSGRTGGRLLRLVREGLGRRVDRRRGAAGRRHGSMRSDGRHSPTTAAQPVVDAGATVGPTVDNAVAVDRRPAVTGQQADR